MGSAHDKSPMWEDRIGELDTPPDSTYELDAMTETLSPEPPLNPKEAAREEFLMVLADVVRFHRYLCGWTQKELSERTGIPIKTISRIESASYGSRYRRRPHVETIRKLVVALRIEEWKLSGSFPDW